MKVSLKNRLRDASGAALFRSGVTPRLLRRPRREQIVLLYHNPDPSAFARHLEFLSAHYAFAPLPGLPDADREDASKPRVGISFDDGYRGVHTDIRPLLRDAGVPATMFVPTGFLGKRFRYEALKLALQKTERSFLDFDGRRLTLESATDRKDAWHVLTASLKLLSSAERDTRIDAIIVELGVAEDAIRGADVMTRKELAEMAADLEIGSHTVSHPNLARVSPAELRSELADSKRDIEAITGRPCRLFAYPIGRSDDYTREAFQVLGATGYSRAFSAVPTTSPDSLFEYPRVGVGDFDSVETLCLKLSRAWPSVFRLIG